MVKVRFCVAFVAPIFLNDLGLSVVGNQLRPHRLPNGAGCDESSESTKDIIAARFGQIMNFAFIRFFIKTKMKYSRSLGCRQGDQ